MKYQVYIVIENNFTVEAESEEDADRQVMEMDPYRIIKHSDLVITETTEVKEEHENNLKIKEV